MIQPLDLHILQMECWREAVREAEEAIALANEKLEDATGARADYWRRKLKKAEKDLTKAQRAQKRVSIIK
jgi:hypothetical protein